MKRFVSKMTEVKVVSETLCNSCGSPCVIDDRDNCHIHWSCKVHIEHICLGSHPGQFTETSKYDICQKCWNSRIKPLLGELPANREFYDVDENTTIVSP